MATILSLASSVGFVWGVLEVYNAYQARPSAGFINAGRRAARKYGINL